jgi:phosphoglycerate dehydrogenase-like enzyme
VSAESGLTVVVAIFAAPVWTLPSRYVDQLRRRFPDVRFIECRTHEALEAAIVDAQVAFSSVIRDRSFANARSLRWIHSSAAGVGGSLFPALVESDVIVTNSRGLQTASIAEHILAVVLAWRRGLHTAARAQHARVWAQKEISTHAAPPLSQARALIVGMGSIGREAARLLRAVGVHVEGLSRRGGDDAHAAAKLPELLAESDVVVIAAPHTPETDRLFDAGMLARMKPGSLLVNVGRGRIVDEGALIEALRNGRPGTAALDVFEREPLAPESPLWQMENVIATPHIAGFGAEFWERTVDLFAANFDRWRNGEPLLNLVDKRRGY